MSTQEEKKMTDEEVEDAILNDKPFELDAFNRYSEGTHEGQIKAEQLEVGDVFKIDSADIVDYNTVLKVLSINDPGESWIDYTFRAELMSDPGLQKLSAGDTVELHYDEGEPVGNLILV